MNKTTQAPEVYMATAGTGHTDQLRGNDTFLTSFIQRIKNPLTFHKQTHFNYSFESLPNLQMNDHTSEQHKSFLQETFRLNIITDYRKSW